MEDLVSLFVKDDLMSILSKRKKLIKALSKASDLINKKVAVLGGSSTQEIVNYLELFLLDKKIKCSFYEGEFGQYYEESVFTNDKLKDFNPDVIYVYLSFFNITNLPSVLDTEEDINFKHKELIDKICKVISSLKDSYDSEIIITNIPLPPYRLLGNLEAISHKGCVKFIRNVNESIHNICASNNVHLHDVEYLSSSIGLRSFYDLQQWNLFRFAQSQKATMEVAYNLSAIIGSLFGKQKKLLITDLDNTMWGGVIGDDGVDNIQIGFDTPKGEIFSFYQEYLKKLYTRGIVLSVCSKNNDEIAKEGIEKKGNVLKYSDFALFIANWENKDININNILSTISLGADATVFVDDNPVERNLVKQSIQDVSVVDEDSIYNFVSYIDKAAFFEPTSIVDDDLKRNDMYKQNITRIIESSKYSNYDDYIISLKTELTVDIISDKVAKRCCQKLN